MARDVHRELDELRDSTATFVPSVMRGNISAARYVLDELGVSTEWNASTLYSEDRMVWGNAETRAKDVALDGIAFDPSQGKVPNVRGLGAKDAVYMLESCGLNVRLSGSGKVRSQSIPHGSKVSKGQTIYLTLK